MKALTIKQPWAQLIVDGIKDIENRTWKANFRGRVYVHAAQSDEYSRKYIPSFMTQQQFDASDERFLTQGVWTKSAIIGEVDIIDCVLDHSSIWAQHTATVTKWAEGVKLEVEVPVYNWVLANPVKYDQPILNVKGALSFWQPDLTLTNVH